MRIRVSAPHGGERGDGRGQDDPAELCEVLLARGLSLERVKQSGVNHRGEHGDDAPRRRGEQVEARHGEADRTARCLIPFG